MTSVQIRTFSAPPDIRKIHEKSRTSLNTRFRSLDDLDELETLVLEAQQRNDDLQNKFSLSRSKIATLFVDTRISAGTYIDTAQELSLLRHSLTDDLTELSQESISTLSEGESKSTLLEDIETLHRNLRELQSVKGYVQVIEHTLRLSERSAEQIRSAKLTISTTSLSEYQTLQAFVKQVTEACSKLEDDSGDQTMNLVSFVKDILERAWAKIQDTLIRCEDRQFSQLNLDNLTRHLNASAEKIGWPTAVDYPSASVEDRAEFEHAFRNLLRLQNWGEQNRGDQTIHVSAKRNGLYPLQALVHPIALRFKYHFDSTRPTNRLDKPEWYFTHVLNVAHEHRTFMETVIQRLLDSSDYRNIKAWHEFTYLLLPLLSRKLKHTVPALLSRPSLLAHTIYQALTFDAALLDEGFLIQETSAPQQLNPEGKWEGVSGMIIGNDEWFEAWLRGEQNFAEEQYHEIISTSDAWLIAGAEQEQDDVPEDLKATHSARRICSLIEQVTDRYSPLPRSMQCISFLLSVQLPLLHSYHGRISASLDAFETLSSAFVRAVPGALSVSLGKEEGRVHVDNRGLTSGVDGVQRLCKALLSAKYVERTIRGWAEELFFVELWAEINHKDELRNTALANPLLPDPKAEREEIPEDTLFDEVLARYDRLVNRAEGMIVQQVCGEIEGLLKAHFSTLSPKPDSQSDNADEISLSQTLLAPMALLSSHLTFLRTSMSQAILTNLYRRIISRLADHILHRQIVYRSRFDVAEGKNIRAECELWVETCRIALGGALPGGRARIDTPWTRLLQAASLASAEGDAWATVNSVTFGTQIDDWDAAMMQAIGPIEMGREEVMRILRRREDCNY
ncbi:RAD50-interacting protein 1 [Termitomyces sp. J132]|nr:RAD50-interacting protein 1 [Termitomyces sp. J132]